MIKYSTRAKSYSFRNMQRLPPAMRSIVQWQIIPLYYSQKPENP